MAVLEIKDLKKSFGKNEVLKGISFTVEKGEAVATAEARKQIALYIRSFRGASQIRAKINLATTFSEVREALEQQLNIL